VDCPDRVHIYGGYAEFVAIGQNAVLPVSSNVALLDSAVVACAIGTSVQALVSIARIGYAEFVAVTGAGGGLGVHAIQVAAALGARPIAVTTSADKSVHLRELGAEAVIYLGSPDFQEAMRDATGGPGPHVVLDNVGHPAVFSACFRSLRHRGRYVFIGQLFSERIALHPALVFHKEAVITGSASTTMASFMSAMELVASGRVRPVTTQFSLEQARDVHNLAMGKRITGRALLLPALSSST
jgi:D-arabinose 1-dehydrogenase-like Zn-dependent alcohol dehydrogenase